MALDSSLKEGDIYKCLQTLDINNDGSISLNEFLALFEFEDDVNQIESENQTLEAQQWPLWLVVDGHTMKAKELIIKIFELLTSKISNPERAFSVFEVNKEGLIRVADF